MTGEPVGGQARPGPEAGTEPTRTGEQPKATTDEVLATQTVIEATTGAPLTAFPQRAPQVGVPDLPVPEGPATGVARVGGAEPARGASGPWADPVPTARAAPPDWPPRPVPAGSTPDPARPTPDPAGPAPGDGEAEDFWLPIEEVHWDGTPVAPTPRRWWFRRERAGTGRRHRHRDQRHPAAGLAGLLVLGLLASFFAWVSAEPLWLAFGHGDRGTATVLGCTGSGLGQQCRGDFTATGGSFTAWDVRLAGVDPEAREPGTQAPARMVGAGSRTAYLGTGTGPLHLRWSLGMVMVLLTGLGIAWVTGALRLPGRWPRRAAALAGLAGPLLLTAGFVTSAYWTSRTP
nr:hypothetical protein [Micromonospora sp. DSM 115978]